MVVLQLWKQRLYAFLLRRVLGPLLDDESLQRLHHSLDVSLHDGRLVLSDVGLNLDYLASKMKTKSSNDDNDGDRAGGISPALRIRKARVERLEILLSLVEHGDDDGSGTNTCTSSLAWRAMQLGSSTAASSSSSPHSSSQPAVSLVAKVEVDGVLLEVVPRSSSYCEPTSPSTPPPPPDDTTTDATTTPKTLLASYIDAALASLRLSVRLLNLTVRLSDDGGDDNNNGPSKWVELGLEAASYRDNNSSNGPTATTTTAGSDKQQTIFDKTLELHKVTIRTGEMTMIVDNSNTNHVQQSASSIMALLDGNSQLTLRMVEYYQQQQQQHQQQQDDNNDMYNTSSSNTPIHVQHDAQVNLERLSLSADARALQRIQSILESCSRHHRARAQAAAAAAAAAATNTAIEPTTIGETPPACDDDDDDVVADLRTIDGIMRQYYDARVLAQRNHFRNGILLPSDDCDDLGEPTFEAFFDANDQSFSRYSTVLRNSVVLGFDNDRDGEMSTTQTDAMVHTKLRVHVQKGSLKLVFAHPPSPPLPPSSSSTARRSTTDSTSGSNSRSDEYLLLTFADVQANSSVSKVQSEHTVTVAQLDVEDSQVELEGTIEQGHAGEVSGGRPLHAGDDGVAVGRRVEIGSVLRFVTMSTSNDNNNMGELLVQPSCLSLSVRMERGEAEGGGWSVEVELDLEPVEITYRRGTMTNLVKLIQSVSSPNVAANEKEDEDESNKYSIQTAPSHDTAEKASKKNTSIYVSCTSLALAVPIPVERDWAHLYQRCGYACDTSWTRRPSFSLLFNEVNFESSSNEESPTASLACNYIIASATSPSSNNKMERKSRKFDIFCLAGRDEVDPLVPVSIKFWRNLADQVPECGNAGTRTFPKVPTISSFKARQEDEDDDIRIDRVLSTKFEGMNMSTARRDLRGNDPQADMLLEASKSDRVVEIRIPEVMADCSAIELSTLSNMLEALTSRTIPAVEEQHREEEPVHSAPVVSRTCVSLECDFVAFGVHGDDSPEESTKTSFALHLDKMKAHILRDGSSLKQARILSEEVDLYELSFPVRPVVIQKQGFAKKGVDGFRQRLAPHASSAGPLFHRSQLFPPISQDSPMVLFDLIDRSMLSGKDHHEPTLRNVYFTLYDMTYRYNPDSQWIERLMAIIQQSRGASEGVTPQPLSRSSQVTRTFLSLADCNIDCASSPRYNTPSRMILRVGDLRVSSNIVSPKPALQAFSIALGDAVIYLCKTRYPYNFENSQLPRSALVMCPNDLDLESLALPSQVTPDTVQKAMSFLTIATLESSDAVITLTNRELGLTSEPEILANLTIGDLCIFACKDSYQLFIAALTDIITELTAVDDHALEALKAKSYLPVDVGNSSDSDDGSENKSDARFHPIEEIKRQSAPLYPAAGASARSYRANDFLLDGYDWTTIDQDESSKNGIPPGEEQSARWYGADEDAKSPPTDSEEVAFLPAFSLPEITSSTKPVGQKGPNIVSHHFPIVPVVDPLADEDMGLSKYAGTVSSPRVKTRVLVHDLTVKIRLFDGFDWPELLDERQVRGASEGAFVIDDQADLVPDKLDATNDIASKLDDNRKVNTLERKAKLMGDLLSVAPDNIFQGVPLPEERGASLKEQEKLRRLARRTGKYFQFAASGISVRVDSLEECSEHRLASCMNIKAQDFFVAETVSRDRPVKLSGEWLNDAEHPRATQDGLFMMKMVTWHPITRVTPNDEIVNDEAEATAKLLPLRWFIDQKAIRFIRAFFRRSGDDDDDDENETDDNNNAGLSRGLYVVPPPLFRSFRFKPFKVKVDYRPETIDTAALRNGAFVELVNLSPLDGMVLMLDSVEVENIVGFGNVISLAIRRWIEDVASTQMYKFLTSTRYLEPIAHVGGATADVFVLPWEALQSGESVRRALRAGIGSFSGAMTYEACTTTSRATQFMADQVAKLSSLCPSEPGMPLPARPLLTPRGLVDTAPHVVESLSRGFQTATYKVVIVPFREYRRRGARGAATSVMRGIPVAIAAPTSGTAEALSYALMGVRNQLLPDIRREEESLQRGLHWGS